MKACGHGALPTSPPSLPTRVLRRQQQIADVPVLVPAAWKPPTNQEGREKMTQTQGRPWPLKVRTGYEGGRLSPDLSILNADPWEINDRL